MIEALLVDDEVAIADVLARSLRAHGVDVRVATSGKDALIALTEAVPDVLVLDINLPDITGWELLRRMSKVDRQRIPVIVFSAAPLAQTRIEEFKPSGVLTKPFPIDALLRLIGEATADRGGS